MSWKSRFEWADGESRRQFRRSSGRRRFTPVHCARKSSSSAVRTSAGIRCVSCPTGGSSSTTGASGGMPISSGEISGASSGSGSEGGACRGAAGSLAGEGPEDLGLARGVSTTGVRTWESPGSSFARGTASRSRRSSSAISPFFFRPAQARPPEPARPAPPAP